MKYLRFAPLGRDLSRLVLGTAAYERAPLDVSLDLFDAFRDLGGNLVDTGRQYGNAEPVLGRWLRERGLLAQDDEAGLLVAAHDLGPAGAPAPVLRRGESARPSPGASEQALIGASR